MLESVSATEAEPVLRIDGENGPVDLVDLEDDLRWGRISPDAELMYPPWTGAFYLPLTEVRQLRDALGAPAARLAARLRSRAFPWATVAMALAIFGGAIVQSLLSRAPGGAPWLIHGRVGWDAALLNGQWWGAWTAHILHWDQAPVLHAFANITFILYCGMRVEQAWGVGGLMRVVAGAMAGGALAVMLLSDLPVVGSSMIAFGLIGAQVAIGFRMDESIPRGWRGMYGWGNLLAVIIIFSLNKVIASAMLGGYAGPGEGVSHLGHTGGLLGGVAAIFLGTPQILRPRRGADAAATLGWLSLPVLVALILPLAPRLAGLRWVGVEVEHAAVSARLPWFFLTHPVSVGSLRGWVADPNNPEPVFLDRVAFSSYADQSETDWTAWWQRELDADLQPAPVPAALDGWEGRAWVGETRRVVEYQRQQGLYTIRGAWVEERDGISDLGARERMYRAILSTAVVGDPALLVTESEKHGRNPRSPDRQYRYAYELWRAGRADEADALLAELLGRTDGWEWDAARLRLQLLTTLQPSTVPASSWLAPFLAAPITDMSVHRPATIWLASRGECSLAQAHGARISTEAAAWIAEHEGEARSIRTLERGLAEMSAALQAGCASGSPEE